jgi:hypothetical protein
MIKTHNLLKTALLALAGTALVASSSMAQSATTYAQGDFLLGFRATGGTGSGSNVLVDIGPGSSFLTSTTPVTFSLSNLFATLNGVYSSGWTTRSDVFWSVAGADSSSSSTVYITAPETVGGSEATPWTKLGTSSQTGVRNKINTEGGTPNTSGYNFYTGNANPYGAGPAVIEGQTDSNSYGSYHPGGTGPNSGPAPGISYAVFNPTIEGTFANGTGGITLDLIKLGSGTGPGQDLGDFTISNNGILTFKPDILEVPEPSTYASVALGAGLLLLIVVRRRRQSAKL